MFGKKIELFNLFGFKVNLDASWFLLAVLITWSLATSYFPGEYGSSALTPATLWLMGAAGALGLFISIVLHELAHSIVARNFAMSIRGITLFIFGGVAEMEDEPPTARAEFWVAVAGPLASLLVAGASHGVVLLTRGSESLLPLMAVMQALSFFNLVLVIFNLVPAFPLDGGRILRSLLWQWRGSLYQATRITAAIGSGFGLLLIGLGSFAVYKGNTIGGLWQILIGFFVRGAARAAQRQSLLRRAFEGETVGRFLQGEPIAVPRHISVEEFVRDFIYQHHLTVYPVVDGERLIGCVSTGDVRRLPREEWNRQSVGVITRPCGDEETIRPDGDVMEAFARMQRAGRERLLVAEDERLVGVLTLEDLLRFLYTEREATR